MKFVAATWLALGAWALSASAAAPWTLEQALGCALTNSPDARIATHRIAAAQAGLEQANSAFWPRLSFQSGYTGTDNPMLSFGNILNQRSYSPSINFNDVPGTDNLNVRGLLTVPLYTGGKITADKRAAQAGNAAARQDAQAVRQTLAGEVARAFFIVLKTRQFIGAAQAAVTSYETNAALAQQRFEAGAALRADVLDLEVRLAQSQEDLVRARNANALAQRALQNLLGIEDADFAVADSAPALIAPVAGATAVRPESLAAAERARAAAAQIRSAKSGYRPRLSAFGSLDYDHGWVLNGDSQSYTAGVLLQWDLWDGRLTRAKVSEAWANLEIAREQERKVRLAVNLEAEQARLDLQQAQERSRVGEKTVAQAEESLTLTRERFAQGAALATQLIEAQTALTAARVRRADAQADVQIATAALRKALGLPILEAK
jgi:outer membrane protein TolC